MLKARLAELDAQGLEGDELVRRERELDDSTMYVHFFSPWPYVSYFRSPEDIKLINGMRPIC